MHRNQILSLLSEFNPRFEEEKISKQTIITFVQNNAHCFERWLDHGHITASSWLLNKKRTQALLLHHKKLNRWLQLGGHCDGNSDVLAVSIKEAQEESGIKHISFISPTIFDIDVHVIPTNQKEREHIHYDIRFLLQIDSDEHVIQNNESNELRWIGKNKNELPTDERSVVRMFEKWCLL